MEATYDALMYQHVKTPTRYRGRCTPSRLDLVFTKEEAMIDEIAVDAPLGKSDHVVLTWELQVRNLESMTGERSLNCRRNFRKGDYVSMKASLQRIDWCVLEGKSVAEAWEFIRGIIMHHIKKFVPMHKKKTNGKQSAPWWNKELTKEVKLKYSAWKE